MEVQRRVPVFQADSGGCCSRIRWCNFIFKTVLLRLKRVQYTNMVKK